MVKVELKGVHRVRSGGRTYYYAWRGGPRLAGEPGTPQFMAAFTESKNPLARSDRKKFATWVRLYKASEEFKALSDMTKYRWGLWLDQIIDHFGELSLRQFDHPQIRIDIRKWRDKWRSTPRTADYAKQVLSRVLSYAAAEGALSGNPCAGVKNVYRANRAAIIWEQPDIEQLCAHASKEIGDALRLACLTGFRQGDLLRLTWHNVKAHSIEIRTAKSRERVLAVVPVTAEIRALLASIPQRSVRILTNSNGQPWRGFGSSWNKAMKDAGLGEKGLHFHDARGTACTRFYCAGFSYRQIAKFMGWEEDYVKEMIDRYVKHDEIMKGLAERMEAFTKGS